MKHLETSYQTHDGLKLYLQAWLPDAPKAGLLLIHGLGEHSGRYSALVEKLVAEGIAVFTFDGRGHGRSVEGGPDAYFSSYRDYLEDIDALYGKVRAYLPGLPTFLYGHSMGGGMAAAYVIKYQPNAAGVILSSPAIKEAEGTSKLLIAVSGMLSKWLPRLKALKLDPSRISRIPEEVHSYLSDPLNYTQAIPARTAHEVYQMMQMIQAEAVSFELPVLLLHGTDDGLTNPKGSELFVQKVQSEDKNLRLFPGGYHELIHDHDREELIQTVVDWVKERG
ncbi:MAG: lysophospholipase [Algoriphagus aquaeductus]|uniref:alpha/beta hydrolase n=1 Tax=Algoriphagus aquaeductus TaxID=475299 RepID=UPI003919D38F